jgi:hypothetical protein
MVRSTKIEVRISDVYYLIVPCRLYHGEVDLADGGRFLVPSCCNQFAKLQNLQNTNYHPTQLIPKCQGGDVCNCLAFAVFAPVQ